MTAPAPNRPGELPLVARARRHGEATALVAPEGTATYTRLLAASAGVAARLLAGRDDLGEERVAFLVPPGFAYTAVLWGIWRAGGIAVPLAVSHPPPELAYTLEDSEASSVIAHPDLASRVEVACQGLPAVARRPLEEVMGGAAPGGALPPTVAEDRRALILYTSGTTSRPKGVVWTHGGLTHQVETLVQAWGWSSADRALLVLPLHHVHGLVNVLTCALWSGATCEILPRFDAGEAWERLRRGAVTVFMAVPTIYVKLLAAWDAAPPPDRRALTRAASRLRLMVSGSAALPVPVLERWREAAGHTLLERYGMTEIGMALSNPLEGERVPGAVGRPLPGVRVRLVDGGGAPVAPGEAGEIEVSGPGLFREYWRRPQATREAFRDGWFRTGDVAVEEGGVYRILGRESVDIVKSGGYKVSALEVEAALREHPQVADCAVVGLADPEWGERLAAAVLPAAGARPDPEAVAAWARERLAPYKVPRSWLVVGELPRNALGKVLKPRVRELFPPAER